MDAADFLLSRKSSWRGTACGRSNRGREVGFEPLENGLTPSIPSRYFLRRGLPTSTKIISHSPCSTSGISLSLCSTEDVSLSSCSAEDVSCALQRTPLRLRASVHFPAPPRMSFCHPAPLGRPSGHHSPLCPHGWSPLCLRLGHHSHHRSAELLLIACWGSIQHLGFPHTPKSPDQFGASRLAVQIPLSNSFCTWGTKLQLYLPSQKTDTWDFFNH